MPTPHCKRQQAISKSALVTHRNILQDAALLSDVDIVQQQPCIRRRSDCSSAATAGRGRSGLCIRRRACWLACCHLHAVERCWWLPRRAVAILCWLLRVH